MIRPAREPRLPFWPTDPFRQERAIFALAALVTILGAGLSAFVHPAIGPILILALIALPFVLRSVDLAFGAVIAVIMVLPFAAIPLNLGFNPTFLDLALGLLYLIWVMRLVQRQQTTLVWPTLSAGLLGFLGLMVVAFLAGFAGGRPTNNQLRNFAELLMGGGLFLIVANLIRGRATLERVFRVLAGLAAASAAIGLGLYLLPDGLQVRLLSLLRVVDYPAGPGVLRFLNDDPDRLQRATGTAVDPNSFGGMLAVMAALVLPQLLTKHPLLPRRALRLGAALLVAALLATVSRGSLLGLAAGLGVIGLLRDRRALLAGLLAALAFLLLAQLVPWSRDYLRHFTDGLLNQDRATQMRWGEYRDAWRLIQRYPWLGVGFGAPPDVDLYRGVSSLYLIVAESMGLVGLGAYLLLMAAAGLRLLLAWRRMVPGGARDLVLGGLAALVAALVSGVFDHYFFTYPHAFALLWLILGLCLRAADLETAR